MSEETRHDTSGPEEEPRFVGTLFVVMVFIILTAGMWFAVYLMLLDR